MQVEPNPLAVDEHGDFPAADRAHQNAARGSDPLAGPPVAAVMNAANCFVRVDRLGSSAVQRRWIAMFRSLTEGML